jgi:hypothetical protein
VSNGVSGGNSVSATWIKTWPGSSQPQLVGGNDVLDEGAWDRGDASREKEEWRRTTRFGVESVPPEEDPGPSDRGPERYGEREDLEHAAQLTDSLEDASSPVASLNGSPGRERALQA